MCLRQPPDPLRVLPWAAVVDTVCLIRNITDICWIEVCRPTAEPPQERSLHCANYIMHAVGQ